MILMKPFPKRTLFIALMLLYMCAMHVNAAIYPANYHTCYHRIQLTVNPGVSGTISKGSVTTYFTTTAASISQIGFDFDFHMAVDSIKYHGALLASYTFASS